MNLFEKSPLHQNEMDLEYIQYKEFVKQEVQKTNACFEDAISFLKNT